MTPIAIGYVGLVEFMVGLILIKCSRVFYCRTVNNLIVELCASVK